jgi:glycyl-tRNA synthetase beta chain
MTIAARARALESARANDEDTFDDLATAYARANNLRDAELGADVDGALFGSEAASLNDAVSQAEADVAAALKSDDYPKALAVLASLRKPIDAFFENVMVMDDDAAVRANNLKLLNRFVAVFANVADFGKMAKSK